MYYLYPLWFFDREADDSARNDESPRGPNENGIRARVPEVFGTFRRRKTLNIDRGVRLVRFSSFPLPSPSPRHGFGRTR